MNKWMNRHFYLGLTCCFFACCFFACCFFVGTAYAEEPLWQDGKLTEPVFDLQLPSLAPVVEKLSPSVVNISTEGRETVSSRLPRGFPGFGNQGQGQNPGPQGGQGQGGQGEDTPQSPFDFFFQIPPDMGGEQQSFKTQSLGSGFVISPSGYIITNNHVVDRATKIFVTFQGDKKTYDAKLVGRDKKTDVALLKVDPPKPLTAVVLGDSEALRPGDWVIAIGNPFRLGHTATMGIVSAKSRKVPGGGPYDDYIQTDASINPGNSGGPLFNVRGEVVGVNTAIFSPGRMGSSGFNIGIGFATPINLVKGIVSQIHRHGSVTRGWLGVLIQPVSQDMADALKLKEAHGALVADVMEKSPAAEAGIKRGDVIIRFDGKEVQENDQLPLMVADTVIGKAVKLTLIRGGDEKTVSVTIQKLDDKEEVSTVTDEDENQIGLTVQDLTPDIANSIGLEDTKGVVVSNVNRDSAAEEAGLLRGDVLLEIGGAQIESVQDFKKAVKGLKKNKPVLLLIKRKENTIFLTLKLSE